MQNNKRSIVLTGASDGIGLEAAKMFAEQSHRLFMLCRPGEKAQRALAAVEAVAVNTRVTLIGVDLAEPDQVRAAAQKVQAEVDTLDVLINNAGLQSKHYRTNSAGLEITIAVNFLAPFLLSEALHPQLKRAGGSRIVNVISQLYTRGRFDSGFRMDAESYNGGKAYGNTKLATALMGQKMARRFADDKIDVISLHPGVLATGFLREYPPWAVKLGELLLEDAAKGGQRIFDLALASRFAESSGKYVSKDRIKPWNKTAASRDLQDAVWDLAEKLAS